MPEFTHAISDDGLTLTTTARDGKSDATVTVTWDTVADAEQNIQRTKANAEQRLTELLSAGRSLGGYAKRKVLGPITLRFVRTRGDYDNWLIQLGPIAIRPAGIARSAGKGRLTFGAGGRRSGYALSVERTRREAPTPPAISREDIRLPLKNPFSAGDKVIIPANVAVWETDSKKAKTIDRKRHVTVRLAGDGYLSHERVGIQPTEGKRVIGAIQAYAPYVQWTTGRAEVTAELLEANGKLAEYAEDQYDIFRKDIESGNYELRGMGK